MTDITPTNVRSTQEKTEHDRETKESRYQNVKDRQKHPNKCNTTTEMTPAGCRSNKKKRRMGN